LGEVSRNAVETIFFLIFFYFKLIFFMFLYHFNVPMLKIFF
jgi:hypothetical protein